jgi:microcompartment protein CcmK/EutM
MRLGTVIGRVTLNQAVPSLVGARWLVVSPFTRDYLQKGAEPPKGLSKEPTPVVYDYLGGGVGDTIGFVEGREAAMPFEDPTPIDAIAAVIVDKVWYCPPG